MRLLPAKLAGSSLVVAARRQTAKPLRISASSLDPLEPWQTVRLHEEFEKGKRNVKVESIACWWSSPGPELRVSMLQGGGKGLSSCSYGLDDPIDD
jgi:hypothetical protein